MEIQVNKAVTREAMIRALSDENIKNREAEFVISTEAVDSYGTVFKMSGWDLRRYEQNPIVCYGHRTWDGNPDMVIGVSEVRIENDQLIGTVKFETEEVNPLAEKIWRKVQAGTLRMASIGATPKKGHWGDEKLGENRDVLYFDEQELFEWSVVPVGSNPDALKREKQTVEEIRAEMIKTIQVTNPEEVSFHNRNLREKEFELLNNNK
jgi:HK97 family phage prohead protease